VSYLAASLIVSFWGAAAAAASAFVDRAVSLETRKRHHEVGAQVFQQVGVMFAVLLAFVFSEVWSQYNTAAKAIDQECGALHGASMLANALPNATGRPVDEAIATYARVVIDKEWPTMASERSRSPEATQAFRALVDAAARLSVTEAGDSVVKGQILALLADAHAARETRTFQVTLGLPLAMWIVLLLLASLLVAFVVFAGLENPGHILFAAAFSGGTVMVLVLVRMLDFPFEGALALEPADFVKMLGEVSRMMVGG
jgi:hypothetical protein